MRNNPFVRVRRYWQRPSEHEGWMIEHPIHGICFADRVNPHFERDRRMQSWRRPL